MSKINRGTFAQKNDFHAWLAGRIRTASVGKIWDFDAEEYVDVATAPARIFLEHTHRRAQKNQASFAADIHQKALDQAEADKSDPFSYNRTRTELDLGLCELDDYSVEFGRKPVTIFDFNGKILGARMAKTPMKMRRP